MVSLRRQRVASLVRLVCLVLWVSRRSFSLHAPNPATAAMASIAATGPLAKPRIPSPGSVGFSWHLACRPTSTVLPGDAWQFQRTQHIQRSRCFACFQSSDPKLSQPSSTSHHHTRGHHGFRRASARSTRRGYRVHHTIRYHRRYEPDAPMEAASESTDTASVEAAVPADEVAATEISTETSEVATPAEEASAEASEEASAAEEEPAEAVADDA